MSEITIFCSADGCNRHAISFPGVEETELINTMVLGGWVLVGADLYCPDHVAVLAADLDRRRQEHP